MADVGQRVRLSCPPRERPDLPPWWFGKDLEVLRVVGAGNDQMVELINPRTQRVLKWVRSSELAPAPAHVPPPADLPKKKELVMDIATQLVDAQQKLMARNPKLSAAAAAKEVGLLLRGDELEAYRCGVEAPAPVTATTRTATATTRLAAQIARVARERGLSPSDATEAVLSELLPGDGGAFEAKVAALMKTGVDARTALRTISLADARGAEEYRLAGL